MTDTPLGNRDLIRAINRSIILNAIKTAGEMARAEIARLTGLSPATVTGITADLITEGLLFEKKPGNSSGGRRPILLAINPHGGQVAGIKLMETQAVGALIDLNANVLKKDSVELTSRDPNQVIAAMVELTHSLVARAGVPGARLLGVGVGMAGVVDSERGMLRQTPFQGWHNLPVREILQAQMGIPVYVDNDVNTLVVAEQWFGCGQQVSNFLVVTIGRGIGLGIVANHQFYRGARGGAGEFGHTLIDPEGPLCACGKRGCLEAFVGDQGLVAMARAALRQPIATVDELVTLANVGDSRAQAVLARAGVILGRAIANLINIFDPQLLLISGEGVRYGHWLFDSMHTAITENVMEALRGDVQIKIEPWGDDDWARGAASLVLRELFEHPVRKEPAHS